jgi:hypothetical protein
MRAVGYFAPGPIAAPDSLRDIELPRPSAGGRDLLVDVRAVSVNPVDYKVRASAPAPAGAAKVIGWDASRCTRRRCGPTGLPGPRAPRSATGRIPGRPNYRPRSSDLPHTQSGKFGIRIPPPN